MIGVGFRLAFVAAAFFATTVLAQHLDRPDGKPSMAEPSNPEPFRFTVHGAFRRMMHMQDYSPKVPLRSIMDSGVTEAVGAAAQLRGEITVIGGKLLLTYGTPCQACGDPQDDDATLLVAATVAAWHPPVLLPSDLTGKELDTFIIERATALGLDTDKSFPLRIAGTLLGVKMHIIRGANPRFKGHASGHPMADQRDVIAERTDGEVVGFYAPYTMRGVATHPDEPFHFHWVDLERTRTAHLDAFGLAKGAILLLPKL